MSMKVKAKISKAILNVHQSTEVNKLNENQINRIFYLKCIIYGLILVCEFKFGLDTKRMTL